MAQNLAKPTAEMHPLRFVIERDEADVMRREMGLAAVTDLLPALVPAAQRMARPSISGYHVGACALGASGRIYLGVNVEFPGVPLHHTIHAEQFVVTNAAIHGERAICFLAVSDFPCGHCRQFLQEIRSASQIQILITGGDFSAADKYRPLYYFLPHPFGPSDLLNKDVPLLLEPHRNDLIDEEDEIGGGVEKREICVNGLGIMEEELRAAAVKAAMAAHAPYSGCASGFALAGCDGKVYSGSYIESAAYNPSVGPLQAAVVAYLAAGASGGGGVGEGIVAAVLAEREGAAVSQEATARTLLAAIAPKVRLSVYPLRSSAGTV
ncbi:cytidine deaminase [Apostasia shenzhenica]|uniref:cytidine deaminase n=1 Tax=Apostasia shenzhenica TaxID=1088818 RepID=A0A2I0B024_9ASPA|nr:cytidine deaminase [Apostasia shenzhenica]